MNKLCKRCWITKNNNDFRKDKSKRDWLEVQCKKCRSKTRLKYVEVNYDTVRRKDNLYRKTPRWALLGRLSSHKREAIKNKANDGTINIKMIYELMYLQFNKCLICDCDITNSYHIDHIKPLSKWGEHSRWNIQLLCPTCNLKKSDWYNW